MNTKPKPMAENTKKQEQERNRERLERYQCRKAAFECGHIPKLEIWK